MSNISEKLSELEVSEIFNLLESNKPEVCQEIKSLIAEHFTSTKESWLVGGLYEYYLQTGSSKCCEILCGITKEPHIKFLIERLHEGIKSSSKETKKLSVSLLCHLACKQPSWLYKIMSPVSLFKDLTRMLRHESDPVILMTGILAVVMIIPIIPIYITASLNDIFDVFGRMATYLSYNIPREYLLHLQVALYSLFHRLYAMFPCNFLSYLRHNFSSSEKRIAFLHTVMPMLEKVKMHPALVTGTKEGELSPERWKSKEYHDVIAECSKISLDVFESSFPEEVNPAFSGLVKDTSTSVENTENTIFKLPISNLISQAMSSELTNLSTYIEDSNTAPPTPLSVFETAMEATPENTPVKESRSNSNKGPVNPAVAVQLTFGSTTTTTASSNMKEKPLPSTPPTTPYATPVPSSPAHIEPRRDSIFDSSVRRDSVLLQRLHKVILDQQQSQNQSSTSSVTHSNEAPEPVPKLSTSRRSAPPAPISIPHEDDEKTIGSGPLTPANTNQSSSHPMMGIIDPDLNEEECSGPSCSERGCQSGGLHMADNQAIMAFAKKVSRIRFHSQCPSSEDEVNKLMMMSGPSRRSKSCPDIKEQILKEEEEEGKQEEENTKPEEPEDPSAIFFHKILPEIMITSEKGSPSPHLLLDLCIMKASSLHTMPSGGGQNEVARLRGQIELLHCQLLFERHRREAHALRNRRLAGKLKKISVLEETNQTLRREVHNIEKELTLLRKQLTQAKALTSQKEKDSNEVIKSLEQKLAQSRETIDKLKDVKIELESKNAKLYEDYLLLQKESDQTRGDIYLLENEVQHAQKYIEMNKQLTQAYETSQKELIMLGEIFRRYQEQNQMMSPISNVHNASGGSSSSVLDEDAITEMKLAYEDEIRELRNAWEEKSSQLEAANGLIKDFEEHLQKKENSLKEQRKVFVDDFHELQLVLRAAEDKYETLKSTNHRLELEILRLNHQLNIRMNIPGSSRPDGRARAQARSTPSTNGELSPNSDVESAASAGGMYQTSPEQNICIFGSPQFDTPSENVGERDMRSAIDNESNRSSNSNNNHENNR